MHFRALIFLLATATVAQAASVDAAPVPPRTGSRTATTNHERQAEILRKVLDAADRRYLIIDHTKIGRKGLYRIAARGGFDAIISD